MFRTNRNRAAFRMPGQIVRERVGEVAVIRLIRQQEQNHVASAPNPTIRFRPNLD